MLVVIKEYGFYFGISLLFSSCYSFYFYGMFGFKTWIYWDGLNERNVKKIKKYYLKRKIRKKIYCEFYFLQAKIYADLKK